MRQASSVPVALLAALSHELACALELLIAEDDVLASCWAEGIHAMRDAGLLLLQEGYMPSDTTLDVLARFGHPIA